MAVLMPAFGMRLRRHARLGRRALLRCLRHAGRRSHVLFLRLRYAGLRCCSIFRSRVRLRSLMRHNSLAGLIHRLPRFGQLVLLINRSRVAMGYSAAVVGADAAIRTGWSCIS